MKTEGGREEGEIIGAIRTYQKLGIPMGDARRYIIEEFGKNEEETETLIRKYWK